MATLSEKDRIELLEICTRLFDLAHRHGHPAGLSGLWQQARATLAMYDAEAGEQR